MVLGSQGPGRVGRRRFLHTSRPRAARLRSGPRPAASRARDRAPLTPSRSRVPRPRAPRALRAGRARPGPRASAPRRGDPPVGEQLGGEPAARTPLQLEQIGRRQRVELREGRLRRERRPSAPAEVVAARSSYVAGVTAGPGSTVRPRGRRGDPAREHQRLDRGRAGGDHGVGAGHRCPRVARLSVQRPRGPGEGRGELRGERLACRAVAMHVEHGVAPLAACRDDERGGHPHRAELLGRQSRDHGEAARGVCGRVAPLERAGGRRAATAERHPRAARAPRHGRRPVERRRR